MLYVRLVKARGRRPVPGSANQPLERLRQLSQRLQPIHVGLPRKPQHLYQPQAQDAQAELSGTLGIKAVSAYDEIERNPQNRLLHDRIRLLDPFDRAIVLLWLEDLPYDEIGAITGISAKAVGVRLVRIREKLKKLQS